jgi:hypothetical protein
MSLGDRARGRFPRWIVECDQSERHKLGFELVVIQQVRLTELFLCDG